MQNNKIWPYNMVELKVTVEQSQVRNKWKKKRKEKKRQGKCESRNY